MQTLNVALGDRAYPIHIGRGLLALSELILPHLKTKRVAIVTNDVVGPLYLERLRATLETAGMQVAVVSLPDGETHKDLPTLNRCLSNGVAPVSTSYSNTPNEYTSLRVSTSTALNFACSGLM